LSSYEKSGKNIPMKAGSLLCILLTFLPRQSEAQIRELWRTGLTNVSIFDPPDVPQISYSCTESALDKKGATIVAGVASSPSTNPPYANFSACLTKVNSQGEWLWRYFAGNDSRNGVESLAVDEAGNVFFTARLSSDEPRPVALAKLSSSGEELWRSIENFGSDRGQIPLSEVALDAAGNPFFFGTTARDSESGFVYEVFLCKFKSDGVLLWRTILPFRDYVLDSSGLAKHLAVLPDGGAAVGIGTFVGKVDSAGRVEWWTDKSYSWSLAASIRGTLCATSGGEEYTIFSRHGKRLRTGSSAASELQGATLKGGFILGGGGLLEELSPEGISRWRTVTSMSPLFGVVPDDEGWFAAGVVIDFTVEHFDKNGSEDWRASLPGYYTKGLSRQPFHRAADGSFRVVCELRHGFSDPFGIAVISLAVAP
jgi:hypothetical protein